MSVNQSYTKFCLLSYGIKIYLKQKQQQKKKNNTTTKTQPYTATFPFQLSCSCGSPRRGFASRCITSCHQSGSRTLTPPKHRKWKAPPYTTELELAQRLEDDVLLRNPTAPNKNRGTSFKERKKKIEGSPSSPKTAFLQASTSAQTNQQTNLKHRSHDSPERRESCCSYFCYASLPKKPHQHQPNPPNVYIPCAEKTERFAIGCPRTFVERQCIDKPVKGILCFKKKNGKKVKKKKKCMSLKKKTHLVDGKTRSRIKVLWRKKWRKTHLDDGFNVRTMRRSVLPQIVRFCLFLFFVFFCGGILGGGVKTCQPQNAYYL